MASFKDKFMWKSWFVIITCICFKYQVNSYNPNFCGNVDCERFIDSQLPPNKTSHNNGTEYLYFTHSKSIYNVSFCSCKHWNATLLMIKDNDTQHHIKSNIPVNRSCDRDFFYIGLFLCPNGEWRWPDNTPGNFFNWFNGSKGKNCSSQPNANCVRRTVSKNATQIFSCRGEKVQENFGTWFDKNQELSSRYYICQRPRQDSYEIIESGILSETITTASSLTTAVSTATTKKAETSSSSSTISTTTTTAAKSTAPTITSISASLSSATSKATTATRTAQNIASITTPLSSTKTTAKTPTTRTALTLASSPSSSATIATRTTAQTAIASTTTNKTKTPIVTALANSYEEKNQSISNEPMMYLEQIGLNLKKCLSDLILGLNDGENPECKLSDIFGKDFTIEIWEKIISILLGEIMLANDNLNTVFINYTGIVITLYRLRSFEDLVNQTGGDSKFAITFNDKEASKFLLNVDNFKEIASSFAIVSARINMLLLQKSQLSSFPPAMPIDENYNHNKRALNKNFKFLPEKGSVLSFSMFIPNNTENGSIKKVSIPVDPIFQFDINLNEIVSIANLERSNNHRIALNGIQYECVFLDLSRSEWSNVGCSFDYSVNGEIGCSCTHTTTFGVFLAVTTFEVPDSLTLFVTIFEAITVVALTITISLFVWLKNSIRRDRTIVQINLALSLLLLHLFFILSNYVSNYEVVLFCEVCAGLIQFFTLTTAFWMLNEGIVLYFKTYKNALSFNLKIILPWLAGVAWGFPLLYTSLCAGFGITNGVYMDKKPSTEYFEKNNVSHLGNGSSNSEFNICYVGFKSGMIYAIIVPLVIILILTTSIVIKTSLKINAMSKEIVKMKPSHLKVPTIAINDEKAKVKKKRRSLTSPQRKIIHQAGVMLKALILLLPVLGITWFLGFLVNIPGAQVVFIGIHGCINGLQGVFIFYIYCIKSAHFRKVFKRKWKEISSNLIGTDIYLSHRISKNASHNFSHQSKNHI